VQGAAFCQPGLEKTYGIEFGKFTPYDTGGLSTLE